MSDEKRLIDQINANLDTGKLCKAVLSTDDRVLARITDGIYRQPGSALWELIANAYDADAQNVYVQTDAPRFSKISVSRRWHGSYDRGTGKPDPSYWGESQTHSVRR